jgi:CHAT domain-containing protein
VRILGLVVIAAALLLGGFSALDPVTADAAPRSSKAKAKAKASASRARPGPPTPAPNAPQQLPAPGKASPKVEQQIAALDAEVRALHLARRSFKTADVLRKLYALEKKHLGAADTRTGSTRVQLAAMLLSAGGYREAGDLYREGLKLAEQRYAKDSMEVAQALQQLMGVYWVQGRYADADPMYQRVLPIWKKLYGEKSELYAGQLTGYAGFLTAWSAFGAAERVYEEALRIYEATAKSPDDPSLISPLQTLGWSYWSTGKKAQAQALFTRLLALNDKRPDADAQVRASTVYGVASVYHYGGRPDLAKPLFEKARTIYREQIAVKEKAGAKGYELSGLYTMLAMMEKSLGNFDEARQALTRGIAIEEKESGNSSWYAILADIERADGKPKVALALIDKAEANLVKLAGPSMKSIYAVSRAEVLRDMGRFAEAEDMMRIYVKRQEKSMGERHPTTGSAYLLLAGVLMQERKIGPAEESLGKALDIAERELGLILSTGSESDHVLYFFRNAYVVDMAINLHAQVAPGSKRAAELAMTTVLRRKGRILDASAAALAALRGRLSPDDAAALEQLDEARAKLAKLIVAGPEATGPDEYAAAVAELDRQVRQLEELIRKRSAAYRAVSSPIELDAVQAAIPDDERLVEIVSYQPFNAKLEPKNLPPRRYGAYLVAHKGAPSFVELGEVTAIDTAVEQFRTAVSDPDDDRVMDRGRALYDLTLGKIVPKLGGATKLALAPDGQLNLVPFAALVDPSGGFVVQKYTITYLTSGRDLLRGKVGAKPRGKSVIIADPAFGSSDGAKDAAKDAAAPAPANDNATEPAAPVSRGRRSRDLAISSWRPLPGTRQEAEAIHELLRGAQLLRGEQATEGALKKVAAPLILHVATHGFFLPSEAPPPDASGGGAEAGRGAAPGFSPPQANTGGENPLLRSGLALAGANSLHSGGEDGILTALEASGLDLWGTRLVVLSACETGVGKASNGEGVYGLRRALVIAGAESLVMSLWQVDDLATRDLMTRFYRKLEHGEGRSAALRAAQLETLAKPAQRHPFYWAAFQPTGDGSPIKEWK